MIIRNFKRKVVNISLGLIVIGFIISIVGFGIDGFDLTTFKSSDSHKWYKIINSNDGFFSFGINF
ncbi:MAG: hypothetical protein RSD36_14165 [Terrisporobacter sp.]